MVLSRKRCPHTGIINIFTKAEPLLPVGFVLKTGAPKTYRWACFSNGQPAAGTARSARTAARHIARHWRSLEDAKRANASLSHLN